MMDEQTQLDRFHRAVTALGGAQAAAAALALPDDDMAELMAGQRALDATLLEALSRALIDHATLCRALERQLSPAFAENRTAAQVSRTTS